MITEQIGIPALGEQQEIKDKKMTDALMRFSDEVIKNFNWDAMLSHVAVGCRECLIADGIPKEEVDKLSDQEAFYIQDYKMRDFLGLKQLDE